MPERSGWSNSCGRHDVPLPGGRTILPVGWRPLRGVVLAAGALVTVVATMIGGLIASAKAEPDPNESRPNPYPELQYFTEIDAAPYSLPNQGVWFVTPQGLNCGIWFRGSFGCSGNIAGAPDVVHQIGWLTGDTRVHYDWTLAIRFPPTHGAVALPPLTFIKSEGTACATTLDDSTYCERGPWRFLITPTHTWLN